ncbi:MAG: hypothetical protein ABL949_14315 [Fimbriimonadaceae bacterium]
MRLAWVTCRELPEPDHDEELALSYLRENGFAASAEPWDDDVRWESFDAAILRSCWNYYEQPKAFLHWVDRASQATRLLNPAPILRWNVDKIYLFDLEQKGVPVVPTAQEINLDWQEFVIKPRVSAGSYQTRVYTREQIDDAVAFMAEVENPIVQPYLSSVEGEGERSIIWINGEFTHAIRKNPRFDNDSEAVSEAYVPSSEEMDIAERALNVAPAGAKYARADVMRDDDGLLRISELELIEPSLFLTQHPAALSHLANAIRSTN